MKNKPSPINAIWFMMIILSIAAAAWTGKMNLVTAAAFDSAKSAVTLAIGLIGAMALWLGLMKVVEEAGGLKLVARAVSPIMKRLFPNVPHDHPAMSAMVMNIAANMLGLGNAATPMGIKAMTELDKLNKKKGTATDAMCLFLAINTSSVTLLPLGVITVRAAAGATSPAAILVTSIFATIVSTITAIFATKILQKKNSLAIPLPVENIDSVQDTNKKENHQKIPLSKILLTLLFVIAVLSGIGYNILSAPDSELTLKTFVGEVSTWLIPLIMALFLFFGYLRGVKLYEAVTEGAKEGFSVAIKIITFMVAIFVGVGMF